ncbi:hypothetical protein BuS5_00774 [Desulfosarcina sp. BuS5]|uniref:SH3 domain-containing protein n=1 Tax=Desulfosarcina sp. BuS5 TaxID=933262 RepID=UPI0004803330|nr:SH3 domain-containing protein [Desulfosarcina sp. BuS5]WDN87806.1 hypothetical protein BuS5_00774 [Desulfosarcina sp. BuS5]
MKYNKALFPIAFLMFISLFANSVFCSEISGWVKSETCWVVKEPSKDAKIIGIILKKAAVTVEDVGNGWAKIIFAPVRDPQTGKYIDCTECYIQRSNVTTVVPGRW